MTAAVDDVMDRWQEIREVERAPYGAPLIRDAALITALRKVATVTMQRDIWM